MNAALQKPAGMRLRDQKKNQRTSGAAHGVHGASGVRSHWLRVSSGPGVLDVNAAPQSSGNRSSRSVVRKKVVTCVARPGRAAQQHSESICGVKKNDLDVKGTEVKDKPTGRGTFQVGNLPE